MKTVKLRQSLLWVCYLAVLLPVAADQVLCVGCCGARIVSEVHSCCEHCERDVAAATCSTEANCTHKGEHDGLSLTKQPTECRCLHLSLKSDAPHIVDKGGQTHFCGHSAMVNACMDFQPTVLLFAPKAIANPPNAMATLDTIVLLI